MKSRTKFECGHRGYGQYCHLCKQIEEGELIQEGDKYLPGKKLVVKWAMAGKKPDHFILSHARRLRITHEIKQFINERKST